MLQRLLRNVLTRAGTTHSEYCNSVILQMRPDASIEDLTKCTEWNLWYDFFCMPNTQTATYDGTHSCDFKPPESDFLNATASIPAYIELCTSSIVLAPPVCRLEEPSMVLDCETWKN